MKKHTSAVVREALNDWNEMVHVEQGLGQLAASEGAFSRRLLFQYAIEAAAAGDERAAKILAAMGRTHARIQRELQRALSIAAKDRRAQRRPAQPQRRRLAA